MNTEIWIDLNRALIIKEENGATEVAEMVSGIDHFNARGGSGGSTPYGPQDAISESTLLNRRKEQIKHFVDNIIDGLDGPSSLLIIGPAQMKLELEKRVEQHPSLSKLPLAVETLDSLTDNQIRAFVREHFAKDGQ